MKLTPNGNRRVVEAQMPSDPNQKGFFSPLDLSGGERLDNISNVGNEQQPSLSNNQQVPQDVQNAEDDDNSEDISTYIFKKLESFGYPPRRLEQFFKDFVQEKIYPGDFSEATVTIPDSYYGKKKRISNKDLSAIVKDIKEKFGYSFIEATRKDKKIVINFTSKPEEIKPENKPEDGFSEDELDEIYGGGGNGSKNKSKSAQTIHELIKISQQNLYNKIKSINNESN